MLEVVLAAAIFGMGFLVLAQLVDTATSRVYQANLNLLAHLFSTSILARYAHAQPSALARAFNDRGNSTRVIAADPVLAAVLGQPGARTGRPSPQLSLTYTPVPGDPGIGRLESAVTVIQGDRSSSTQQSTVVYGRKLPASPSLSAELADTSLPSQMETADLVRRLESAPDDPVARIVLPVIRLEASHGPVTRPYTAILRGTSTQEAAAAALEKAASRDRIPDGIYACDWVSVYLSGESSHRVKLTFFLLSDRIGTHRLLAVRESLETEDHQITVAQEPALDVGDVALATGRGPSGVCHVAAPTHARVRATRHRAFVMAPRLTGAGAPSAGRMDFAIVTFPKDIQLDQAPDAMHSPICDAMRLVGLAPAIGAGG